MSVLIIFLLGIQFLINRGHCQDIQIVTYWGQNSAYGQNSREEKDLVDLCREDSPFDIINVGFVEKYFDILNKDNLPGLNFAGHCRTPIDPNHRTLFSCPVIERGIRTCQQNGKKVLIAIGGPRGKGRFDGESQAEKFAENIWNLFLAGEELPDLRPFGSAVCDGVNLLVAGGSFVGYPAFIRHLFYLTKRDKTRKYIITASPSCNFPDSVLGPAPNKALEISLKYINHLYIRFYGSNCGIKDNSFFEESLDAWLDFAKRMMQRDGDAPLIFVGVPAMDRASPVTGCYQSTKDLREIYKRLRENKFFGGFMVWDASWDQTNIQYGKSFSERLLIATKDYEEQETENFDEDEEEENPIEPPPPTPVTPQITLATTPVTYSTQVIQQTLPPQTPPPQTPAPTNPPTPPPTNPQTRPPDSPDENPYENNNEMEEGEGEPEETPEQLAAKPAEGQEEEQQPQEGEQEGEGEEEPQPEGEDQEEDPYQPRPPDMENRFPPNQPEPVNDDKAYQEESIPFSLDAELQATKAEKERKRIEWLKQKKKEQWLKIQQSQHIHPINVPTTHQQYPAYSTNSMQQNTRPQSQQPGLTQAARYPVMPYGFYSKQQKLSKLISSNRKDNRFPISKQTNKKSDLSSSESIQIDIAGSASGSGSLTESGSGSQSGSGASFVSSISTQKSLVSSGSLFSNSTGSGSGTFSSSGSGSGLRPEDTFQ